MNAFQICTNTSDAVPLYLPQQLFLKPIARLNISLQLPQKKMGKSISNLEVIDCLRSMIKPEKYCILKVTLTTLDFIRFEAELNDKSKLEYVIAKLDNKTIKLKEFPELLKLRASAAKINFPSRHDWDTFFRDAKNMNEMKPGERPDTIHITNLPIKWFVHYCLMDEEDVKPSEKILYRVFEKFGPIRRVDIPICDPYRCKMKAEVSGMQTFDFKEEHFFEGYVQFKDYIGFSKAMDALYGMKLLNKGTDEIFTVNINIDFDRTKHLSDASIRRREIVRDRLVRKEVAREEKERNKIEEEEKIQEVERQKEIDSKNAKEQRRQQREEKRKRKILDKLKIKGSHEINEKIAKEEKKLLKVQRRLEAIRLVEELFKRIKNKKEKDTLVKRNDNADELTRFKNSSELEVLQQQEKLHRIIEGRVVLKSVLAGGLRSYNYEDSSSSDSSTNKKKMRPKKGKGNECFENLSNIPNAALPIPFGDWYGYSYPYQMPNVYSGRGAHPIASFSYIPRGRGLGRCGIPSSSRGFLNNHPRNLRHPRYRNNYRNRYGLPQEMQDEYYKYFEKFSNEHDDRSKQRVSRSSSHSRRRRNSKRHTTSRSRSRSYSKERRSYSHSKSRSRSRKRSRSYSRKRCRSRSNRSHSNQRSPPSKSISKRRSRSMSARTPKITRSPSYKSIDTSKFISPNRLRMPRSKSWSLPKEGDESNPKRSWSKSPSPK